MRPQRYKDVKHLERVSPEGTRVWKWGREVYDVCKHIHVKIRCAVKKSESPEERQSQSTFSILEQLYEQNVKLLTSILQGNFPNHHLFY